MLKEIKKAVLNYYLLTFEIGTKKVTFQEREQFIKNLLNRIMCATGFLGIILFGSRICNYPLVEKICFPLFMLSLIPYFIYGIMVKLHNNEKKVRNKL